MILRNSRVSRRRAHKPRRAIALPLYSPTGNKFADKGFIRRHESRFARIPSRTGYALSLGREKKKDETRRRARIYRAWVVERISFFRARRANFPRLEARERAKGGIARIAGRLPDVFSIIAAALSLFPSRSLAAALLPSPHRGEKHRTMPDGQPTTTTTVAATGGEFIG